jgi:peptide chain release factor 3
MELERQRGISITSTVLQFPYRDHVLNLLDTPGHRDFSEDTYRVLAAADAAVMVLDAAKGIEPQTLKLFEVCRDRGVPLLTFLNKWDRPGLGGLELLDEIERQLDLHPMAVTWPVGIAGSFRGVVDRRTARHEARRRPPKKSSTRAGPKRRKGRPGRWQWRSSICSTRSARSTSSCSAPVPPRPCLSARP